jgi:membrane protein implicated in regulation of membrane protease activity
MNIVVEFSPRMKFIAITVDELILIPLAIVLVYFFLPDFLLIATSFLIVGAIIFVAVKYYLIYPTLLPGSYNLYDMQGVIGLVTEHVSRDGGKIKVGQEIWDARCLEGEIASGVEVKIVSRESFKVFVEPLTSQ